MAFNNGFNDKEAEARALLLDAKRPSMVPLEYKRYFFPGYADARIGYGYDNHITVDPRRGEKLLANLLVTQFIIAPPDDA